MGGARTRAGVGCCVVEKCCVEGEWEVFVRRAEQVLCKREVLCRREVEVLYERVRRRRRRRQHYALSGSDGGSRTGRCGACRTDVAARRASAAPVARHAVEVFAQDRTAADARTWRADVAL